MSLSYHPCLPFLLESLLTAGSLRSTAITPLHSYCGPLRHPLAFHRFPGFASYAASLLPPSFMAGRGGLLQLLDMSLSPCCPYHARRSVMSPRSARDMPCCLRPEAGGSASGSLFVSRPLMGLLSLRPRNSLTILTMALSVGFIRFVILRGYDPS